MTPRSISIDNNKEYDNKDDGSNGFDNSRFTAGTTPKKEIKNCLNQITADTKTVQDNKAPMKP